MKFLLLFVGLFIYSSPLVQLPEQTNQLLFGIRVSYSANGEMVNYVMYQQNGTLKQQQRKLSRDEFIKFASGYWPSPFNYQKFNYFEKYGIDCGVFVDSITKKEVCACPPLDSLWKIHYARWPFSYNVPGWAGRNHLPSFKQQAFLHTRYGVKVLDQHFFADTSCWMLLRDVTDPLWISAYLSLR